MNNLELILLVLALYFIFTLGKRVDEIHSIVSSIRDELGRNRDQLTDDKTETGRHGWRE